VTIEPMAWPWRTLNCAIDFLARVVTARWPVILLSSSPPTSTILAFDVASPRPMLTTTFSIFGMAITLV
jgi:hypothetical protein